jgi:cytoskeletal protein CcmA (bactofilin family)
MFEKHKTSKPETAGTKQPQDHASQGAQTSAASGRAAVIGPGIRINGDISGDENLLIEGRVEGKILLESNNVDIGQGGKVKADISARVIRVSGEVRGDLDGVEKVIISRTGNVHGNIKAPRMTLEDGAIFKGSIDMDPGEPAKAKVVKPVNKGVENSPAEPVEQPNTAAGDKPKGAGGYSLN